MPTEMPCWKGGGLVACGQDANEVSQRPWYQQIEHREKQKGSENNMKGKQPGRPVHWAQATVQELVPIGKPGVRFEVWEKWKKTPRTKLGTLTVSIGGLRWWPQNGKRYKKKTWDKLAEWFGP